MTMVDTLSGFLAHAYVAEEVFALRPDYRTVLVAVDGIEPGPSDATSEEWIRRAESAARAALAQAPVDELQHVAAWREAYRSFGAKPQRTRSSVEALIRRAEFGLPRVNRLTDIYNAISVLHQIPLGGEDLSRYSGSPRLIRATGDEPFDTVCDGEGITDYPSVGEVVWCDDAGVTCRRWNWRQTRRTQLDTSTTSALFILDALDPLTDAALSAAVEDLTGQLKRLGPDVHIATRAISIQS